MSIKSIFLSTTVVLLAFAFLMAGTCKLTPALAPAVHDQLTMKFTTLFTPFLTKDLNEKLKIDFKIDAIGFRDIVGAVEVLIGLLILTPLKRVVATLGLLVMIGAIYVDHHTGGSVVPPAVLGVLCFLVVVMKSGSKSKQSKKTA